VYIWDKEVPREVAFRVGKALRPQDQGFVNVASLSFVRCLCWIVYLDYEGRHDAKVAKRGETPQDLRDGATQFEAIASKIERSNLPVPPPPVAALVLKSHAKQLRSTAEYRASMIKGRTNWRRKARSTALDFVLQTLREKTGSPKFQQIADFLTGAAQALGIDSRYDADAVKMRAHRKVR
jgi:hypothetical protein